MMRPKLSGVPEESSNDDLIERDRKHTERNRKPLIRDQDRERDQDICSVLCALFTALLYVVPNGFMVVLTRYPTTWRQRGKKREDGRRISIV